MEPTSPEASEASFQPETALASGGKAERNAGGEDDSLELRDLTLSVATGRDVNN